MRLRSLILAAALVLIPATASAAGALIDPSELSDADRGALFQDIAAAKKSDPAAFAIVAQLKAELPRLDANKRGRLATVTPALKALKARALMPMLEELAVSSNRGALNDTAWLAWRLNLLEAVGALRDGRSAAVLEAVLDGDTRELSLVRAAAQALGKLNSDRAANKLVSLSRGTKRLGVLAGMGHCRRTVVAERLADALPRAASAKEAAIVARSLGDAGNAWAWQTSYVQASGEEADVRAAAAEALVAGFVAWPQARKTITQAILVVDDPSTPALIAAARNGADADLAAALDALAARFSANPTR